MKAQYYNVVHQYQPTNTTCSQTAAAILLSHYSVTYSAADIEAAVPQALDEHGTPSGTINQLLATWCIGQGFAATLYTADVQIIDQSWAKLAPAELASRLTLRQTGAVVPSLGPAWTKAYAGSYLTFLEAGGHLQIEPYISSSLMYKLLRNGPFLPLVCYNTLYGTGKTAHTSPNLADNHHNDIDGQAGNHSIVVYGNDADGNFLVADPMRQPGRITVGPERLVAAIATAQIECDNMLFQLEQIQAR